jgi:hypothetical protein
MGTMTFLLPADLSAERARELERACVAGGPDNMPWPTRAVLESGRLTLYRQVSESGCLVVPWEVDGTGVLMGSTATLMERSSPYHLQVELARGKLNQLRGQAADWRAGGLPISDSLEAALHQATHTFGQAVIDPPSAESGRQAQDTLVQTYRASQDLLHAYIGQVFQVRQQREPRLPTSLGCRLMAPLAPELAESVAGCCTNIQVAFPWNAIEATEGTYRFDAQEAVLNWAEARGLAVAGGPLVDFSAPQMPDWLWLWERDLDSLHKFMANYVTAAVKRYRRRIRRWQITAASNSSSVLSLGEDELLWLSVRLVQAVRQVDPELEVEVTIAQPWGDYLAHEDRTHSPFIFADTLLRSDLHLAALDLEVVMGIGSRGTYCRDLLDTSRLLDLYALLGVPLRITLGYPSTAGPDAMGDPELRVDGGHWGSGFSPENQAEWAGDFAALMLCKPYVRGVTWTHAADADAHQFPHCGLLDGEGHPKPVLQQLRRLREQYLV